MQSDAGRAREACLVAAEQALLDLMGKYEEQTSVGASRRAARHRAPLATSHGVCNSYPLAANLREFARGSQRLGDGAARRGHEPRVDLRRGRDGRRIFPDAVPVPNGANFSSREPIWPLSHGRRSTKRRVVNTARCA